MRSLIILAHPEENSFNAQMADVARRALSLAPGHSAEVLDLYRLGFDPLEEGRHFPNRKDSSRFDAQAEQRHAADTGTLPSDVKAHLEAVEEADLLILQYPMWWYMPPAILKGWLDRVFVYGRAYTSRMRYDAGKFRDRRAMQVVTTGGPEATFRYNGRNGDIQHLLWPLNFTLHYLGFTVLEPFVAFGVEGGLKYSEESVAAARLRGYLADYGKMLENLAERPALPFNGWADWNEEGRLKPGVEGYSPFMRAEP
ncbi:MAG: NAD(P)H-dependent oxidoreductase [Parvibaculaceae bacterium]